jgi:hypothetical protein
MADSEQEFEKAAQRMADLRAAGYAVEARYDRETGRVVVLLNNGVQIAFPVHLFEGLSGASGDELGVIEISGTGLGLHWPLIDADVYVPALLRGTFGTKKWMAAELGAAGGRASTAAKAAAARENGRKGGRPRRSANG